MAGFQSITLSSEFFPKALPTPTGAGESIHNPNRYGLRRIVFLPASAFPSPSSRLDAASGE